MCLMNVFLKFQAVGYGSLLAVCVGSCNLESIIWTWSQSWSVLECHIVCAVCEFLSFIIYQLLCCLSKKTREVMYFFGLLINKCLISSRVRILSCTCTCTWPHSARQLSLEQANKFTLARTWMGFVYANSIAAARRRARLGESTWFCELQGSHI
jgi:hypothetical protein